MEKDFLSEGQQTKITPQIQRSADDFAGSGLEFIAHALVWVHNNIRRRKDLDKNTLFRRRTADQIIGDGFSTGCTDDTLAFIALARAKGIPTKFIEAIDNRWLEGTLPEN